MGVFICKTQPSDGFEGENMALPLAQVQKLSQRGIGVTWLIFWEDGRTTKRPLDGSWEENVAALQAAS